MLILTLNSCGIGEHLKLESERLRHLHMMGSSPSAVPGAQITTGAKKRYTHKRKRAGSERTSSVKKAADSTTASPGTASKPHDADVLSAQRRRTSLLAGSSTLGPMDLPVESLVRWMCAA